MTNKNPLHRSIAELAIDARTYYDADEIANNALYARHAHISPEQAMIDDIADLLHNGNILDLIPNASILSDDDLDDLSDFIINHCSELVDAILDD